MFWTNDFMTDLRNYVSNKIYKFQYYSDDWHDAEIINKEIDGNNILLTVMIISEESFVISGVRIMDDSGNILGEIQENITKKNDALTVDWVFPIQEE